MKIFIHHHALKHGLTEDQILSAYTLSAHMAVVRTRDLDADPPRWALIGFDQQARPIELVFTKTVEGILIFHANYLTEGFRKGMRP